MFFSSANVFIWKLWLWFYSLAPTYSVTFEEFLNNCSSHFKKYVFIDRYSKDGRVRSIFIGISSPDKPDADGILKSRKKTSNGSKSTKNTHVHLCTKQWTITNEGCIALSFVATPPVFPSITDAPSHANPTIFPLRCFHQNQAL
jgi:hypothetical protein